MVFHERCRHASGSSPVCFTRPTPTRRACRWCRSSLAAGEANRSGPRTGPAASGSTAAAVAAQVWKCRCAMHIDHHVYRNHQLSIHVGPRWWALAAPSRSTLRLGWRLQQVVLAVLASTERGSILTDELDAIDGSVPLGQLPTARSPRLKRRGRCVLTASHQLVSQTIRRPGSDEGREAAHVRPRLA